MHILDSILLVDDDEAANFFHKSLIKKLGLAGEIHETRDGREAYNFIEQKYYTSKQLPSLVLIDIAMPGMDGIELIKELQTSNLLSVKKIPLAVVISSNSDKDHQAINQLGNYPYITKPLNEAKFVDILETSIIPGLMSYDKRRFINELQKKLEKDMNFLKQQHQWLQERQVEFNKYSEEVRKRIDKLKGNSE